MIDFHTHVLPGIDDGSKGTDMSKQMLEESARQGITKLVATPHFYAHRESFDHFLEKREHAIQKVLGIKDRIENIPQLYVGAEVYFFPGMGNAERLPELCIRGTNLLLLEMPFAQWDKTVAQEVHKIIEKQKLQVILAHVERFPGFQKDDKTWKEITQLPLIFQINTESFSGFRSRHFCLKFMKEHEQMLLGSDTHNMTSRPQNLKEGRETVAKKLGEEYLAKLDQRGEKLLETATTL
ncbi:MAG: capsular polysaccharide biosynthesis protein [Lachnospiraceae bacterium]|nr:capsular polysaccharide biosynthesis protein [Lachnospiraceae bacterium]